jgi:hypothetical protein
VVRGSGMTSGRDSVDAHGGRGVLTAGMERVSRWSWLGLTRMSYVVSCGAKSVCPPGVGGNSAGRGI